MKFLRFTLLRKIFFVFFLLGLTGSGIFFFLEKMGISSFSRFQVTFLFVGTLFFAFVLFWLWMSHPLYRVLRQMEALLSGRPYRKIYTERVDEVGVFSHFFNEVAKRFSSYTGKLQEGERMAGELNTAAEIQRSILPLTAPVVPGLLVTAKTRPAAEVGGDNFDFITVGEKTFFYLGDVTGHGVPAGLIMTMVNMLVSTYSEVFESPFDIVVNLNRQLKKRIQVARFMTMVMMKWDHVQQKLSYVGAGHEHILVFRAKTGGIDVIKSGGIALGMVPDNSKLTQEIFLDFAENDVVLLYTDGITEGKNMNGEMFGLERLKESFLRYTSQYNPEGIAQHVADDLGHFMQGHQPDDDISLILVKNVGNQAVDLKEISQKTAFN